MSRRASLTGLFLTLIVTGAMAQTTPAGNVSAGTFGSNTGGGTYTFPGSVGIGTTNPQVLLNIQPSTDGVTSLLLSQQNCLTCGWSMSAQDDGAFRLFRSDNPSSILSMLYNNGYVGIGTVTPSSPLSIVGPNLGTTSGNTANLLSLQNGNGNTSFLNFYQLRYTNGGSWNSSTTRLQQVIDSTGMGYIDFNPPNGNFAIAFGSGICCGSTTIANEYMRITSGGNIGIGTTAPAYKLDVAGQLHTSGSIVFADNTTQSTAWTGSLCGGDYAESIDVSDDRKKYEPGDVLVIDPDNPGKFLKSADPYSTMVMGIYSTKPGVVGRRQTTEKNPDEIPMAMIGIVPVKVSAENGPIRSGDLLVTSSLAGYAMKGTDHGRMLGAVLGKALGSLAEGKGVIEVGVTLQ